MFLQHQAFHFIEHIMTSSAYNAAEKERVQEEALQNIEVLVDIDHRQAAQLMGSVFPDKLATVLLKLKPQLEYTFLQGLIDFK